VVKVVSLFAIINLILYCTLSAIVIIKRSVKVPPKTTLEAAVAEFGQHHIKWPIVTKLQMLANQITF